MLERIQEILAAALAAKAKATETAEDETTLSFEEKMTAVREAVAAEAQALEYDPETGEGPLADARTAAQERFDAVKAGPKNGAALEELRLTGAYKDGLTAQMNALAEWDDAEGGEDLKKDPAAEGGEGEGAEGGEGSDGEGGSEGDGSDDGDGGEGEGSGDGGAEGGTEDLLDEPTEGPRELISATARGRRRRVRASALGSGRTGQIRSRRSARRKLAPIMAGAIGKDITNEDGIEHLDFDTDFVRNFEDAIALGATGESRSIVASVNPYGRPTRGGEGVLTHDYVHNHEVMFGDREDLSVTAAVCGPAEPIREIQSCFTADTPVLDSMTIRQAMYGQIQVYAPAQLPEDATGIMLPAPDCETCPGEADIDCLTVECVDPLDPVKASPIQACLCVSESLAFSAPFVLESYMNLLSARYAQVLEIQRLQAIRAQSFNRTFTPPYGAAQGIVQAAAQVMHLIASNSRYSGPAEDYQIVIPRGSTYTMLADIMNRIFGCNHALDDYLEALDDLGISTIVQTLDADGQHCTQGALNVPATFTGDLGPAGCAPLEPFHQTPSLYIYRKDKFLTASPFDIQVGIDSRDKHEIEQGCVRMIRREWWVPPVAFGCSPSIVLDFEEMCAAGTGPDATDPAGCGMEGGDEGGK